MITAIILASGFSRRMGRNKLLIEINNKPIIKYIMEAVNKTGFDEKIIVTNNEKIISIANDIGIKSIFNEDAHLGQSQSIKLGVSNSKEKNNYMFFVGDMPFMTCEVINKCIDCFKINPDKIIIPTVLNNKKNPVIFPNYLKDELLNLKGDIGGRDIIKKYNKYFLEFNNPVPFQDIDTKEDLELL